MKEGRKRGRKGEGKERRERGRGGGREGGREGGSVPCKSIFSLSVMIDRVSFSLVAKA
jgi:hypothetical protein